MSINETFYTQRHYGALAVWITALKPPSRATQRRVCMLRGLCRSVSLLSKKSNAGPGKSVASIEIGFDGRASSRRALFFKGVCQRFDLK
jgi:hypothetical protein